MKEHLNFFENLKEAQMRLNGTIVLYDEIPYYVAAITNHRPGGRFSIYLCPINSTPGQPRTWPDASNYGPDNPALGPYLDTWLDTNGKTSGVIRKDMDSPKFNKYRPYPLGMCNSGAQTFYIERQPQRKTEQGLTKVMLFETPIQALPGALQSAGVKGLRSVDIFSKPFHDCVVGSHPSAEECLENLLDPSVQNEAAAFDRHFALVRGPIEMLFLAYKAEIVGVLQKNNFEYLRLGRKTGHVKEVVQKLGLFQNIT